MACSQSAFSAESSLVTRTAMLFLTPVSHYPVAAGRSRDKRKSTKGSEMAGTRMTRFCVLSSILVVADHTANQLTLNSQDNSRGLARRFPSCLYHGAASERPPGQARTTLRTS